MAYRILVVDDEAEVRDVLNALLTMKGYEVITAADGMAAVTQAQQYRPDLMLLDISMPRMSGFQTCQMIRRMKDCSTIPVIFLTAKKAEADRKFGERLGGNAYVTKPYNQQKLLKLIEKILRERADPSVERERVDHLKEDTEWQD